MGMGRLISTCFVTYSNSFLLRILSFLRCAHAEDLAVVPPLSETVGSPYQSVTATYRGPGTVALTSAAQRCDGSEISALVRSLLCRFNFTWLDVLVSSLWFSSVVSWLAKLCPLVAGSASTRNKYTPRVVQLFRRGLIRLIGF